MEIEDETKFVGPDPSQADPCVSNLSEAQAVICLVI